MKRLEVDVRPHGEQNLDGGGGASSSPLHNIANCLMLQEVNALRKPLRIIFHEPQSAEMQPVFLEIASLFGATDAVNDHSFYDLARLATSHF